MKTIAELTDGLHFFGQLLVCACSKGVTSQSKKYLTITFQDATGTIEAKRWDPNEGEEDIFLPGNIVQVDAEVISYKDHLQMKVLSGEKIPADNIDFSRFVPSSPIPQAELEAKLDAYLDSLSNPEVAKITKHVVSKFRDRMVQWPAAVRNHHNYVSGLLHHSISMADLAEQICKLYPQLNRDVLIAGTIIHDLGKTIELSGPVATTFTLEGKLLGHISIMQAELRQAAKEVGLEGSEVAICLEHMVLSHHGKPEFGSPVMPLTREAQALAMIDDFDAKMMILDKAFVGVESGGFTSKIFTMDDRYFYLPKYGK